MSTPVLPLIAATAFITLGYWLWAKVKPFKNCRHCAGLGRIPTRTGRGTPKTCRRCKGTGQRPRAFRKPSRAARRALGDAFERDRSRS